MKKQDIISLLIIVIFAGLLAILLISCSTTWVWVKGSDGTYIEVDSDVDSAGVGYDLDLFRRQKKDTISNDIVNDSINSQ